MNKSCKKCGETKPLEDFLRHPKCAGGYAGTCKACHAAYCKSYRLKTPAVQAYDRQRAKEPGRKRHIFATTSKWRSAHPVAYAAHMRVVTAVSSGALKKMPCLFCGAVKVHAHHRDYNKPLDVVWLCAKCHHRLHATFPETAAHEKAA